MWKNCCKNSVATFVESCCSLFFGVENQAFATCAHNDAVTGVLEVDSFDVQ